MFQCGREDDGEQSNIKENTAEEWEEVYLESREQVKKRTRKKESIGTEKYIT